MQVKGILNLRGERDVAIIITLPDDNLPPYKVFFSGCKFLNTHQTASFVKIDMLKRLNYILVVLFAASYLYGMAQTITGDTPIVIKSSDFSTYMAEAEKGDSEAMRRLAVCYQTGTGVEKDLRKAWEWYGKSAAEGNTEAEYDIGVLYRDGIGTAQNYKESAYWFRKAASNGHALAMLNIAHQFAKGEGVLQDYRIAAENYWRAAEKGNAEGAYYYACMLRDGIGVEKNLSRAYTYFNQAAISEYKDALNQAINLKQYAPKSKQTGKSSVSRHNKTKASEIKAKRGAKSAARRRKK